MAKSRNNQTCFLVFVFMACTTVTVSAQEAVLSFEHGDEIGRDTTVDELVRRAVSANPRLGQLSVLAQSAYERVPQVRSLPDPIVNVGVFGQPIETAAGSQRANLTVAQKIPWLRRLNAQGQQALLQADALQQLVRAESLLVASRVRFAAFQVYLAAQKIRINQVNQTVLKTLSKIALSRLKVGKANQGDVLRATLEVSRLQAELLELNKQLDTVKARLNALLDRPSDAPLPEPKSLNVVLDDKLTLQALRTLALNNQPELVSASLRQEAMGLGIRIAKLQQVPDLTVGFSTFFIDNNRPPSRIVDVGQDAWSIGVTINIPLWRKKYKAMQREATANFHASVLNVQSTIRRYESAIAAAFAQGQSAKKTAQIFEKAILPQARQTLSADQQSYQLGKVEFDRVITDFRNVINAEVGYHAAVTQFATAVAQLEQLIGVSLRDIRLADRPKGGPPNGPSP